MNPFQKLGQTMRGMQSRLQRPTSNPIQRPAVSKPRPVQKPVAQPSVQRPAVKPMTPRPMTQQPMQPRPMAPRPMQPAVQRPQPITPGEATPGQPQNPFPQIPGIPDNQLLPWKPPQPVQQPRNWGDYVKTLDPKAWGQASEQEQNQFKSGWEERNNLNNMMGNIQRQESPPPNNRMQMGMANWANAQLRK